MDLVIPTVASRSKNLASDYIFPTDEGEQESFQKAKAHEDNDNRLKVMYDEMSSLKKNNTYELV